MSEPLNSSCFCLFCYKTIAVSQETGQGQINIRKFIKILSRLKKYHLVDALKFGDVFSNEKLLDCCNKCNHIIDNFCKFYNQLEILELKLEYFFDKLVEKISYANKVPSRWIHVNSVLEDNFPNELDIKAEMQKKIRKFRQNIVRSGHQRKLQSQPRVWLSRTENIVHYFQPTSLPTITELPIQQISKFNVNRRSHTDTNNGSNRLVENSTTITNLSDETECDDLPELDYYRENYYDDVEVDKNENSCSEKEYPASSNKKSFQCKICEKLLKTSNGLQLHLKCHNNLKSKKWKCKTCGKSFMTKFGLRTHERTHKYDKFKCKFCQQTYLNKIRLDNHLKEKHGEEKGVEKEISRNWHDVLLTEKRDPKVRHWQMESLIGDKKFSFCGTCGKPFPNLRKLKAHINDKLCAKTGKDGGKGEVMKCEICERDFDSVKNLWVHQKETHEKKVCLDCGKQFKRNANYKLHLEWHKDPKDWKFECEICKKKFPANGYLKEHVTNHSKKKNKRKQRMVKIKIDVGSDSNSDNEDTSEKKKKTLLSKVKRRHSQYGLRKNRVKNFVNENDVDSDDNENLNYKTKNKYNRKSLTAEKKAVTAEIVNGNEQSRQSEIIAIDINDSNDDNLLTEKGDCFGDGNLVEFEDLD